MNTAIAVVVTALIITYPFMRPEEVDAEGIKALQEEFSENWQLASALIVFL